MPTNQFIVDIANFVGFDAVEAKQLSVKAPRSYKRYRIDKANGKKRTIYQPTPETKALQYGIMELLLAKLPVSDIACGYIPRFKSPLRTTVGKHAAFQFSVRLDFTDFFYSIGITSLSNTLARSKIIIEDEDLEFLNNCLFVDHHGTRRLAIGSPSSPAVSNAVMIDIDTKLLTVARGLDPKSVIHRYADDVLFSTNQKGVCHRFVTEVGKSISSWGPPTLKINKSKTILMSRGTRRLLLGLIITPEGDVSLGRKRKRYIRHLIHEKSLGNLTEKDLLSLRGLLAFVKDVEPSFINKLSLKYTAGLVREAQMGI